MGAVLRSFGADGSALSMKNIERVLLPALTVKRYCLNLETTEINPGSTNILRYQHRVLSEECI